MNGLLYRVNNWIKRRTIGNTSLIKNINYSPIGSQKCVLVCYLDYRSTALKIDSTTTHPNQMRFMEIVKAFINHGYVIDCCQCNDLNSCKAIDFSKYEYIFGFGKVFDYAASLPIKAKKIIYMTEAPYSFAMDAEKRRKEYFYNRHNFYPPEKRMRTGEYYTDGQERKADIIVFQGEKSHFQNLDKQLVRVYTTAFINERFSFDECKGKKDPSSFVIFGTSGNWIRKGVDLLFEAFSKHPELTLYICGPNVEKYMKELHYGSLPNNIIDLGFINYKSDEFIDLFSKCSYILLPSCFEGMSSAIATGMIHGAIPIVSHNTGYDDLSEYCLYFEKDTVEEIEKAVLDASKKSVVDIERKGLEILKFAKENFTVKGYSKIFNSFLDSLD